MTKRIGFLSFGHWTPSPYSQTRTASDSLLQAIDLAVATEQLGGDGAYFRVHHFARQLGSPFPLLAAIGARTSRIEIGTAVIDMRYENPYYMVEDAGAADLIAGGRLQLGISRGSPEQVVEGWRYFGYEPAAGEDEAGHAREPRVSVSRSIFALVDDRDRAYFGRGQQDSDQLGYIDGPSRAIFGRSYAAEPDVLVEELARDEAIRAADTLLLTVPNQLGVDYCAHAIEAILTHVAPALGWR